MLLEESCPEIGVADCLCDTIGSEFSVVPLSCAVSFARVSHERYWGRSVRTVDFGVVAVPCGCSNLKNELGM